MMLQSYNYYQGLDMEGSPEKSGGPKIFNPAVQNSNDC